MSARDPWPWETLVVPLDKYGAAASTFIVGSWTSKPLDTLLSLARAAFPRLEVREVKWSTSPAKHTRTTKHVLEVWVADRAQAPTRAVKYWERPAAPVEDDPWTPADDEPRRTDYWRRVRLGGSSAPVVQLDDTKVVNTCPCCSRSYTEKTWADLPLLSSREHREGGTLVREVMRNCLCGSTRMVTTTRIAPERKSA